MLKWPVAFALFATFGAVLTATPIFARAQDAKDIGKAEYEKYCADCHGISGKGNGPRAESLAQVPTDLTKIQRRNGGVFPSNKLLDIIDGREYVAAHGPRDMPVWGRLFKEQDTTHPPCEGNECFYSKFWRGRILAIVTYIQSLQVDLAKSPIGDRSW
jgi:mono/diheme cytochrome c family protein